MLAQKLALSYGSRILIQVIQVAVTIVVARVAGPTVLGTIAFGLAFVNMFAVIADLGIPTAYIKSVNDGDNYAESNGTFLRIQWVLIALFIVIVFSWLIIQKYGFHYHFESKTHEYVIIVSLIVISIQRVLQGLKTLFIAKTEQAKQDVPDFIYSIIYQILRLIIVLLGYKALAIAFSNLVATLLILPIYIYLLKPYPIGNFNKSLAIKYFKISLPIIIILIVQTVLAQADKVILQYFSDSKTLGYYTAGFSIGGFVQMIGSVIGLLFFPLFAKAISENNIQSINIKINKFERFMFIFVFPFTFFAVIYSDVIVKVILGKEYLSTIPILSVITISMFFFTLIQPYANTITAKGKFYQAAIAYLMQLVFFILVVILFIHPNLLNQGGLGVAWAVFLSNMLLGGFFVYLSKKNIKELLIVPAKKVAAYAIIFNIIAFYIYQDLANNILYKVLFGILFFFLYWSIGFTIKIFNMEDWDMFRNLINLKKMIDYIGSEIFNKK